MRKRRILPASLPISSWPLSRRTRNIRFGRASVISPSNSTFSSTAIRQVSYRSVGEAPLRHGGAAKSLVVWSSRGADGRPQEQCTPEALPGFADATRVSRARRRLRKQLLHSQLSRGTVVARASNYL